MSDPHCRWFLVGGDAESGSSLVEARAVVRGNRLDQYPASAAVKLAVLDGPLKLRTRYFPCPEGMYKTGLESAATYLIKRYPEAKEL